MTSGFMVWCIFSSSQLILVTCMFMLKALVTVTCYVEQLEHSLYTLDYQGGLQLVVSSVPRWSFACAVHEVYKGCDLSYPFLSHAYTLCIIPMHYGVAQQQCFSRIYSYYIWYTCSEHELCT